MARHTSSRLGKMLNSGDFARETSPSPPEVRLLAVTQKAIAGFSLYLTIERRLSQAALTIYGEIARQFFVWQRQQR